jgi:hypothetical protein
MLSGMAAGGGGGSGASGASGFFRNQESGQDGEENVLNCSGLSRAEDRAPPLLLFSGTSPVSFSNSSEVPPWRSAITGCCAAGPHEQKRLASKEESRFGRLL